MAPDHQVSSGIQVLAAQLALIVFGIGFPLDPPMDIDHHKVADLLCLSDLFQKDGRVIGAEHPRPVGRGGPVGHGDHPGSPQEAHGPPPQLGGV